LTVCELPQTCLNPWLAIASYSPPCLPRTESGWCGWPVKNPQAIAERKQAEHRFHPPLDIVDGAARVVDPIIDGFNTGKPMWGQFLKDFRPSDW
jgi:hypothetical protein